MDKKIDMAMSLNELPFIFDRERTTKILNENQIYTVEDLISCTEEELIEMGITRLTIDYLTSTLATAYLYFRKGNEELKNIETAHLTPEVWERRRYEVAKDIFLKKLDTYGDYSTARKDEMHDSIDLATEFIRILKTSSEAEMQDGDWR